MIGKWELVIIGITLGSIICWSRLVASILCTSGRFGVRRGNSWRILGFDRLGSCVVLASRLLRSRLLDQHVARVGVGMVETVDQNLAGKIVRDERRDAIALVVVERFDVLGVANLMARNEILSKDGLVGICFSEASRSANCLPSMLIACWQR